MLTKKFASKKKQEAKSVMSAEVAEERRKVIEFYRMNKVRKRAERSSRDIS